MRNALYVAIIAALLSYAAQNLWYIYMDVSALNDIERLMPTSSEIQGL